LLSKWFSGVSLSKKSKAKKEGKKGKSKSPSIFSAAGLVRYYEEADIGFKIKPIYLVIASAIFIASIVILNLLKAKTG